MRRRIVEELVAHAKAAQAQKARALIGRSGNLMEQLIAVGFSPEHVLAAAARATGLAPVTKRWIAQADPVQLVADLSLDGGAFFRAGAVPVAVSAGVLCVAYADAEAAAASDTLGLPSHQAYLALSTQVEPLLAKLHDPVRAFMEKTANLNDDRDEQRTEALGLKPFAPAIDTQESQPPPPNNDDDASGFLSGEPTQVREQIAVPTPAAAISDEDVVTVARATFSVSELDRIHSGGERDKDDVAPETHVAHSPPLWTHDGLFVGAAIDALAAEPSLPDDVFSSSSDSSGVFSPSVEGSALLDDDAPHDAPDKSAREQHPTIDHRQKVRKAERPRPKLQPSLPSQPSQPPVAKVPTTPVDEPEREPAIATPALTVRPFAPNVDKPAAAPNDATLFGLGADAIIRSEDLQPAEDDETALAAKALPVVGGVPQRFEALDPYMAPANRRKPTAPSKPTAELRSAGLRPFVVALLAVVALGSAYGVTHAYRSRSAPPPPIVGPGGVDVSARQASLVFRAHDTADAQTAIAHLNEALALDPHGPGARDAYLERARRYFDLNRLDEAQNDLDRLKKRPDGSAIADHLDQLQRDISAKRTK